MWEAFAQDASGLAAVANPVVVGRTKVVKVVLVVDAHDGVKSMIPRGLEGEEGTLFEVGTNGGDAVWGF